MTTIELPASGLVALSGDALASLRNALIRDFGGDAAGYLQQAGYAGGDAIYDAFARWLAARGLPAPESLDVPTFGDEASRFFAEAGWGTFTLGQGGAVAMLDSWDWVESGGSPGLEHPGCHLGTGILAAFFGRVAAQPLAVMEVECRSAGAAQCRFLLGSPETMQRVWEGMAAGHGYDTAIQH